MTTKIALYKSSINDIRLNTKQFYTLEEPTWCNTTRIYYGTNLSKAITSTVNGIIDKFPYITIHNSISEIMEKYFKDISDKSDLKDINGALNLFLKDNLNAHSFVDPCTDNKSDAVKGAEGYNVSLVIEKYLDNDINSLYHYNLMVNTEYEHLDDDDDDDIYETDGISSHDLTEISKFLARNSMIDLLDNQIYFNQKKMNNISSGYRKVLDFLDIEINYNNMSLENFKFSNWLRYALIKIIGRKKLEDYEKMDLFKLSQEVENGGIGFKLNYYEEEMYKNPVSNDDMNMDDIPKEDRVFFNIRELFNLKNKENFEILNLIISYKFKNGLREHLIQSLGLDVVNYIESSDVQEKFNSGIRLDYYFIYDKFYPEVLHYKLGTLFNSFHNGDIDLDGIAQLINENIMDRSGNSDFIDKFIELSGYHLSNN